MAKRNGRAERSGKGQLEFELTVLDISGGGNFDVEASLESACLDERMHPEGTAGVRIDARGKVVGDSEGFVLDSFMMRSLGEYLRLQKYVRRTLERALAGDQEKWDPEGDPVRGEVWEWARVSSLDLRPKQVPTAEELRRFRKAKFSAREIREMVAASDQEGTRSFFTVVVKCDWDSEHVLEGEFRDGVFMGLSR